MKILVCISKTPDTTTKISFVNNNTEFNGDKVQYIMNPYDEWYALVRAIELKEQVGGTVTVVNVGDASNDVVIRKALAIGADDAIRIDAAPESAISVAKAIAHTIANEGYEIVYCGKESIDYNGSQVGAMLSELLDMPYIPQAVEMTVDGSTATIKRDIEGGTESIAVDTPFLLSAAKGLAEQRIPNMRGIMMSKKKPLNIVSQNVSDSSTTVTKYTLPSGKGSIKMIDADNMDELVRLLQEEAKVL